MVLSAMRAGLFEIGGLVTKQQIYPAMEWTPERIARFWDWQALYPEEYFTYQFGHEIVSSLKQYLKGRQKILDYGCGVGYLLPHLCRCAPEVYGTDPSKQSIAHAEKYAAGTPGFRGAFLLSELHKRNEKFDAILVIEVIEHLFDAELEMVFADMHKLLAPGGVVIFSTPNNEDLSKSMILDPVSGETFHRWQHVRNWNAESLSSALRKKNFEIVRIIETNMSVPKGKAPLVLLKRFVKRMLFGNPVAPHLVCVASALPKGR